MAYPRVRVTKLLLVALLNGAAASYAQVGGCSILNVYDAAALSSSKDLAYGLFEVGGAGVSGNAGPLENPRIVLAEQLSRRLKKIKYFSDVTPVAADVDPKTYFVLEGDIIGVNGGSRAGRYFVGGFGNAGQMRVSGRILGPKNDQGARAVIMDWECNAFQGSGIFDFGSSNAKVTKRNAELVSASLSDRLSDLLKERGPSRFGFVKKSGGLVRKVPGIPDSENAEPKGKQERRKKQSQLDKLQDQVASDSDREPITGKTEAVNRSWREKKDWASEDYFDEIQSFVVRSDESRDRSVDALWLTGSCYGAHANLLPRLRQTAILRNREIKRGMLTDLEPVRSFVAQDVYVLIATFSVGSGRAPFLWETERIRKTTYLRRADPSGTPAPPMEFLDSRLASYVVFNEKRIFKGLSNFRAFHPVVMVFPTRQPDGSPLIRGVDDSVELHTEVDGRPVRLTFNLKHFDLRSVDDLKPGSSPNAEASTGTN